MKYSCPNCNSQKIFKAGFYYRRNDSKKIQRFLCRSCNKKFSRATFHPCFCQKKRKINYLVKALLCSGVSQRRCALILKINLKTVAKKLKFLAEQARISQSEYLRSLPKNIKVQMDDLITSEHTKCKPLSVSVAVNQKTRRILGASVSSMPAFGHLAKISRKRYGRRADHRKKGLDQLFERITPLIEEDALFISDEHKFYPPVIKKFFPDANHKTYPSVKGAITGQGELKKTGFDPLFSINHTLAMMRANINRLIRKTWCTTKKMQCLQDHLDLYISFHNSFLIH